MTLETFIGLNRDWHVKFYYPKFPYKDMSWESHEQKYEIECEDYLEKIKKLPVEIIPFDFEDIGVPNNISEVYKSDFLRWYLLSTAGGLWSDMDILYFKPMNSLEFNTPENANVDTGVCIGSYGHSIGFMLASRDNLYYRYIWQRTKPAWNPNNYQSIGSILSNRIFPTIDAIHRILPSLNPVNIPMNAVYAYNALDIFKIYKTKDMSKYEQNSIGLHWYAGHPFAGEFLKETQGGIKNVPTSVIGKTLTALTSTNLPKYIDSLAGPNSLVLDLGCGNKVLAQSLKSKVTTVDIWEKFSPDIVWNLNDIPLPFENDSFDVVLIIDVIEHLKKKKGLDLLEEAKRLCKKAVIVITPLWWTDNIENMMDEGSPYYQNPYERHQSLWERKDFKGFEEIDELSFIGNYFVGVWKK